MVLMLSETIPGTGLGHLMAARLKRAESTALVIAKPIYPGESKVLSNSKSVELSKKVSDEANFYEAIGNGATEGLKQLLLTIAAMLMAFISA